MSHMCGRASSDKEKFFSVFFKQLKRTGKSSTPVSTANVDCKYVNHDCKGHGRHKMKRLRTRKERTLMRGTGKEASNSKSRHHHHHHHCHRPISKDISLFHNPCHSNRCSSTIDAPFPYVAPLAQEPSIITDNRLIGHHGLFNNEVKSIDIERLLSDQRKLEKSGEKIQEKNNTGHLSNSDDDEAETSQMKANLSAKALDKCKEKDKTDSDSGSHPSDITPGQIPAQITDLLSNSDKNFDSSKHSPFDAVFMTNKKAKLSIKDRESLQTPIGYDGNVKKKMDKGLMNAALEHTLHSQEPSVSPKKSTHPSPSSLLHSCSITVGTADSFKIHHLNHDPETVSKFVSSVAANLCHNVMFPYLGQRNLMAKSRKVLLKALQKRHGPQLQRNLLEVQQCLHLGTDPVPKQVQNQEPIITNKGGSWCTDAFTTAFQAESTSKPCFGAEKGAAFKMIESQQSNSESNQWPNKYCEENTDAEWTSSSMEKSVNFLDDIFTCRRSPHFCMDFEPSEGFSGESEHLLTLSRTKHYEHKLGVSQQLDNHFTRTRKEPTGFDSFRNGFMNLPDTTTVRERSRFHHSDSIQPFIPYHIRLTDGCSAEQGSIEASDRFPFAPSFSNQMTCPQRSSPFQSFRQFSSLSADSTRRIHQNDLTYYPPSHMLDRDSASTTSFFPSPEHWSFPPMRLY